MAEEIKKEEIMNEEELNEVVGGSREEFEEICRLLGKNPTSSTREGIAKLLKEEYQIEVLHWNTGNRGSRNKGPAEFSYSGSDTPMTFSDVVDVIKEKRGIV